MPLTFAAKLTEQKPLTLKELLHRHLRGYQPGRSLARVHASDVTKPGGICPRYYALNDVLQSETPREWLTAADQVTYDMGNDWQRRLTHYFADMGRAVANWRCRGCHKLHEFCKRPTKCQSCSCRAFDPEDVRFESAKTGISCGVDFLLDMDEKLLRPIECKGMLKEDFKNLVAPLSEHRLRTNLYLRIIGECGHSWATLVNSKRATIFYACKGGYVVDQSLKALGINDQYSPFKEFEVTRDDKATDVLVRAARALKQYRDGDVGIPHGVCPTGAVARAMRCPMRAACFGGDHPATYNWASSKEGKP